MGNRWFPRRNLWLQTVLQARFAGNFNFYMLC